MHFSYAILKQVECIQILEIWKSLGLLTKTSLLFWIKQNLL